MIVTWKDEGDGGPVRVYENEAEMHRPRPYDPDRPAEGWMTRFQAKRLAERLGAEFREV